MANKRDLKNPLASEPSRQEKIHLAAADNSD